MSRNCYVTKIYVNSMNLIINWIWFRCLKVYFIYFISISHVLQDDKTRVTTYDLHERGKDKVYHKGEKWGKEKKEKRGVIMDIHKQCVWGEIQNTYQWIASAEVIIRLIFFKRYVNLCGGVHGFICIISWNNNVFGIRLLHGLISWYLINWWQTLFYL